MPQPTPPRRGISIAFTESVPRRRSRSSASPADSVAPTAWRQCRAKARAPRSGQRVMRPLPSAGGRESSENMRRVEFPSRTSRFARDIAGVCDVAAKVLPKPHLQSVELRGPTTAATAAKELTGNSRLSNKNAEVVAAYVRLDLGAFFVVPCTHKQSTDESLPLEHMFVSARCN